MNNDKSTEQNPQRQTASNPSGEPIKVSIGDLESVAKDRLDDNELLEKEQQFKEAQTERD